MLHGGSPRDLRLRPHEFPGTILHFGEGCGGEASRAAHVEYSEIDSEETGPQDPWKTLYDPSRKIPRVRVTPSYEMSTY